MSKTAKYDYDELNYYLYLLFIWYSFLVGTFMDLGLLYIGMMGLVMIDMYIEEVNIL
jgi:hypothetical protein